MSLFLDLVKKEKEQELLNIGKRLESWKSFEGSGGCAPTFSFSKAITRDADSEIRIIGEIKPSSPSGNNFIIDTSFDLSDFISQYEQGGINALSVLTDEKYFSGGYELLNRVRSCTTLPILQKEFVIDISQMRLGRMSGANAVLLLTHYFTKLELEIKIKEAESLGLEPVVECSIEPELEIALSVNPKILLINNRPISLLRENASTYLKGEVSFSRTLWENRPDLRDWKGQGGRVLISASCFNSYEDVKFIEDLPYDCILMGNALSRSDSPKEFLHKFKQGNI